MLSTNILLLIPNLDFGGAQRSLLQLSNELAKHHQVYICVFNTETGVNYQFNQPIIDLKVPAGSNWFMKLYRFFQRYQRIRRLKRDRSIQVTISYLEGANYLNVLTRVADKVVLSVRGSKLHDETIRGVYKNLRLKVLIPNLYKKAHAIVALNQGIKKELVDHLGLNAYKISVIRNFYDIQKIKSLTQGNNAHDWQSLFGVYPVLIYSGRIAAGKGLRHILRVYSFLVQRLPQTRLLLVGDGPYMQELESYLNTLNLTMGQPKFGQTGLWEQYQILALGYQDNPYYFIARSEALLIASSSEGGPNALYESMICKTLVVSTDCPYGPRELLTDEQLEFPIRQVHHGSKGILLPSFENGDTNAVDKQWTDTLEQVLTHPDNQSSVIENAFAWVSGQDNTRINEHWAQVI